MVQEISHISQGRMERLVSDGILGSLIFMCVECIKGKQTNQRRYDANRSLDVLELIHTDFCGPFTSGKNRICCLSFAAVFVYSQQ